MAQLLYLMSFLEEPPLGSLSLDFKDDLHLTVLSSFSIEDAFLPQYQRTVRELVKWWGPLTVETKEHTTFHNAFGAVPVARVKANDADGSTAEELHRSLYEELYRLGGRVSDEAFVYFHYNPHISHWAGERTLLKSLTLVRHGERFGERVEVLASYPFLIQ